MPLTERQGGKEIKMSKLKESLIMFIRQWRYIGFVSNWRENNKHNATYPSRVCEMSIVSIGNYTYGNIDMIAATNEHTLRIGNFCSVGEDVRFILSAEHYKDNISTYPFKYKCIKSGRPEAISKGDIIVDDDVWIGQRATILSGVQIGQGAVIAAGAVVTKSVPPYAIVGGVPAMVIKYRFSPEIIEKLMKIDYSKLDKNTVEKNIDKLYEAVTVDTDLSWLPQKSEKA